MPAYDHEWTSLMPCSPSDVSDRRIGTYLQPLRFLSQWTLISKILHFQSQCPCGLACLATGVEVRLAHSCNP